jgi:TnpA family transposase
MPNLPDRLRVCQGLEWLPGLLYWHRAGDRAGGATALGEAIAMYGRIFKTLHILSYIDVDETYRRDIKGIRNLQEGRHALARKICHGRKGELCHRYERGLEKPARCA